MRRGPRNRAEHADNCMKVGARVGKKRDSTTTLLYLCCCCLPVLLPCPFPRTHRSDTPSSALLLCEKLEKPAEARRSLLVSAYARPRHLAVRAAPGPVLLPQDKHRQQRILLPLPRRVHTRNVVSIRHVHLLHRSPGPPPPPPPPAFQPQHALLLCPGTCRSSRSTPTSPPSSSTA